MTTYYTPPLNYSRKNYYKQVQQTPVNILNRNIINDANRINEIREEAMKEFVTLRNANIEKIKDEIDESIAIQLTRASDRNRNIIDVLVELNKKSKKDTKRLINKHDSIYTDAKYTSDLETIKNRIIHNAMCGIRSCAREKNTDRRLRELSTRNY
jgi:hypothetical protein